MPNMSYCRYQNTSMDMQDVVDTLFDCDVGILIPAITHVWHIYFYLLSVSVRILSVIYYKPSKDKYVHTNAR